MTNTLVAHVTVLLQDGTCFREFVEIKGIPNCGDCLRVRGCLVSVLRVVHRTLEPNLSEWADYLEDASAEFDLELVTAPVQLGTHPAESTHPLKKGECQ